jgi:uncharacterized protein (DUF983 family)
MTCTTCNAEPHAVWACDRCDGTGIEPEADDTGALTILLLLGIGILGFELAMALWVNLARWVLQ